MTEAKIRKEAKKILISEGFYPWCPAKAKYQETDIFGIYDCLAIKDSEIRYIQWTSVGNMRAREKKIKKFFEEHKCFIPCEVWGMREDGTFKIIYI